MSACGPSASIKRQRSNCCTRGFGNLRPWARIDSNADIQHKEVMLQFTTERIRGISQPDVVRLSFVVIGLFKKVVMADTLTVYASPGFRLVANGQPISLLDAWGAVLALTRIYFDFSGYSDIAELPINFNSPCIIEFWRRWHITLSRFLRDYVYIPLGVWGRICTACI